MYHTIRNKSIAWFLGLFVLLSLSASVTAGELPILHLRKTAVPLPLVSRLQSASSASAWYSASPTWFGLGGLSVYRNHTEVLASYDNTALYIAFLNIDRSTVVCKQNTSTAMNTVDTNGIWIRTPQGRRFWFLAGLDNAYPAQPRQASGEFPGYDTKADKLIGWQHKGWFAGNQTLQQTIMIPWSAMGTTAPTLGSRWQFNLMNYNQISTDLTNPTIRLAWAPGGASDTGNWGTFAFDEAVFQTPTNIAPEATLTLRPASGFGQEVTLRAGNGAADGNFRTDQAITQSDWNDWDPVDYTIKEYLQFDLSMIPKDRKILSAVFLNHYNANFETNPTNEYLHVMRLTSAYDPDTVTMVTSPLPVENGSRTLVQTSQGGKMVSFDVTDMVSKAQDKGLGQVSFALGSSSGDMNNGKAWGVAAGRADWYNGGRPRLVVTFGSPTLDFAAPVNVGSLNYTSVATTASKNKLTNGTFRYGTVEGISNTTYWLDPGCAYVNEQNMPFMVMANDINSVTGHPAIRFMCPTKWQSLAQKATGIVPGHTYTYSGWYKSSASGIKADVRLNFQDSAGNSVGSGQAVYSGSGNWEQVKLTKTAPASTAICRVDLVNWNSGSGVFMLYSDLQLEEGTKPTAYSETMGVYYPNYPRTDGAPY